MCKKTRQLFLHAPPKINLAQDYRTTGGGDGKARGGGGEGREGGRGDYC